MVVVTDRAQCIGPADRPQSSHLRLVTNAISERASVLAERLAALGPKLREAAARLVERLCWHRRQPMGRGVTCLELCPAYFLTTGEIAPTTAYRAWAEVRGWLGWFEVPRQEAEDRGVVPRELEPGQIHGRFLAVPDEAVELARAVAERAGIERAGGVLSDDERVVERPSSTRTVRCPWHEDRKPSLWLSPSGTARCFGCGACGRWRPGADGIVLLRRWLTERPALPFPLPDPSSDPAEEDAYKLDGSIRGAGGRVSGAAVRGVLLRREVEGGAGSSAPVAGSSVFDALRRADRVAERGLADLPAGLGVGGWSPQDRFLALERYSVGAWSRTARGFRPSSWRSDGLTRFLLLDFDAAADGPVDSLGDPSAWGSALGGRVEAAVLTALPGEVTGEIAVVRTGPSGVQVLVELVDAWRAVAWAPGGWLRWAWGLLAEAVGPIVRELFPGAVADVRATGPGRVMRSPGLRRTKARDGGKLWVSRLAYASPEPSAYGDG